MENGSMDMYDIVTEAASEFLGIGVGVMLRVATMRITPVNDTAVKLVLRETGSVALSTAGMRMTTQLMKAISAAVKPYIVRK